MTNVLYECDEEVTDPGTNEVVGRCGQRWFLPPGGTAKKCTRHTERVLTQKEDYDAPDFFYVDEDGNTKSKRGHIETPLSAPAEDFAPGQRVVRKEHVENFGPEPRVWTPADDAELTPAELREDDLYPHTMEYNADGVLQPTFQGSHTNDAPQVQSVSDGVDVTKLSPEEFARFQERMQAEVERRNAEVLAANVYEEPAPQGEVVGGIPDLEVTGEGHHERGPGGELINPHPDDAEAKAARIESLRDEYMDAANEPADKRWGEDRLMQEIENARQEGEGANDDA
jgi:hypothetical protein